MTCATEKALHSLAQRANGARVLLAARPSQEAAIQLQQAERDHKEAVLHVVKLAYSRDMEN